MVLGLLGLLGLLDGRGRRKGGRPRQALVEGLFGRGHLVPKQAERPGVGVFLVDLDDLVLSLSPAEREPGPDGGGRGVGGGGGGRQAAAPLVAALAGLAVGARYVDEAVAHKRRAPLGTFHGGLGEDGLGAMPPRPPAAASADGAGAAEGCDLVKQHSGVPALLLLLGCRFFGRQRRLHRRPQLDNARGLP